MTLIGSMLPMPGMSLGGSPAMSLTERVFSSWGWTDWSMSVPCVLGLALVAWFLLTQTNGPRAVAAGTWGTLTAATLIIAAVSPLDAAAPMYSFTFHMIQHFIFAMVVPLCALLAIRMAPDGPVWGATTAGRIANKIGHNVWASVGVWSILYFVWHMPGVYDWGMGSMPAHALMQYSFLLAGLWLLWSAIDPWSRTPYTDNDCVRTLIYLSASCVSPTLLGCLIVMAPALYHVYAHTPELFGMTQAADQHWGGLIMLAAENLGTFSICTYYFWKMAQATAGEANHEAPLPPLPDMPPASPAPMAVTHTTPLATTDADPLAALPALRTTVLP